MGGEKDFQAWMVVAASLWWRAHEGDNQPGPLTLADVTAQAGVFANPPRRAANDLAARALALLLIWMLFCAIYRAKAATRHPFSTIFVPTDRPTRITPEAALLLALPGLSDFFPLCQIKHPPTSPAGIGGKARQGYPWITLCREAPRENLNRNSR